MSKTKKFMDTLNVSKRNQQGKGKGEDTYQDDSAKDVKCLRRKIVRTIIEHARIDLFGMFEAQEEPEGNSKVPNWLTNKSECDVIYRLDGPSKQI